MKSKEKMTLKSIVIVAFVFFGVLYLIMFCNIYIPKHKSYEKETSIDVSDQIDTKKISNADEINIDNIIDDNTNNGQTEEITQHEEVLEYLTQYKINKEVPKGVSYVVQEGRQGIQKITTKKTYKNGEFIKEEQTGAEIIKASCNKIIEIGGASYTNNYKIKIGDIVYVTSDELALRTEMTEDSNKLQVLSQGDKLKILEIKSGWYKTIYNNKTGWIKSECTTFINSNLSKQEIQEQATTKTKEQLLSNLNFNMSLNKPSGLSLEQFKKVLSDLKDTNKIFGNNAEYFYYIEKQYNINGIFVAAVGIHESAWGTSKIATQKNNLFGYGAYDSNPYNGAYEFTNYSESIDLISRVFVKYYINQKGTAIYGGETAVGIYYNGSTLTGINTKYASDKNWANAVYSYMQYLYNKL